MIVLIGIIIVSAAVVVFTCVDEILHRKEDLMLMSDERYRRLVRTAEEKDMMNKRQKKTIDICVGVILAAALLLMWG